METDDVPVIVLEEREKCYYFQEKEGDKKAFFPKSQITFKYRNIKTLQAVAVIPLWLLKEKGWNE